MAELPAPDPRVNTLAAIDLAIAENAREKPRSYLGGSIIGEPCERKLWYGFRLVRIEEHRPRLRRIFQRGHDEEPRMSKLLRAAGVHLLTHEEDSGRQFEVKALAGHFRGHLDGVGLGFKEAPKTWHLWELKTYGLKSFEKLLEKGVKDAMPRHYAQLQVYMHLAKLTRAYYMAVCKDDDHIYAERVKYDKAAAERLLDKAERVIFSDAPLERIGDRNHWECRWCEYKKQCHEAYAPENVSCRSCVHVTIKPDGRWYCEHHDHALNFDEQLAACDEHRFLPSLMLGEPTTASEETCAITYDVPGVGSYINGPSGRGSYTSREIAANPAMTMLTDREHDQIEQIKEAFQASLVTAKEKDNGQTTEREPFNDDIPW